ncbi:torsin-1A-like [Tachypleus tridentatus]|uniref:torsin-1A-like n=1 Tax=Tachypleus tridentatus TaxID=6853 RepID=UPI003FD6675C
MGRIMLIRILFFLLIISLTKLMPCCAIEVISSLASVIGAAVVSLIPIGWNAAKCRMYECCDEPWIKSNFAGLNSDLGHRLYGQHLVKETVFKTLKGHLWHKKSGKALVMSFHGWTGVGKNYASQIIAENLYKNGMKSKFVHFFVSTRDFQFQDRVAQYKADLQEHIQKAIKECPHSLFIFDEIDKMPEGVIDALKPFIDHNPSFDDLDYTRAIYIFLSNTGAAEISKVAFEFWLEGKDRTEITLKDIEPLINKGAFNEKGGLSKSDIIQKSLIDIYVPFLPLEKQHVIHCINDDLKMKGHSLKYSIIQEIAGQIEYFPTEFELFSTTGCKRVSRKVDLVIDDD